MVGALATADGGETLPELQKEQIWLGTANQGGGGVASSYFSLLLPIQ